jgi:hypothetical protein
VHRRIFESKRDEMNGGWIPLHNEELHNVYFSPSIIRMIKSRRMRWAGNVAQMGSKRNAYRMLVGKPEGKIPRGKQYIGGWIILRWILERGWGGVDWIGLVQDSDKWGLP